MKSLRLSAILVALLVPGAASKATAQAYPQRPIHLIVPNPPGGFTDLLARSLAERLARSLKQAIVVENKAGAGEILATDYVSHAAADGYTLLVAGDGGISANPYLALHAALAASQGVHGERKEDLGGAGPAAAQAPQPVVRL